jgi:hypothetical protein
LVDPASWRAALSRYEGRQVQIEIHGCRRSSAANRRWWGRIVETLRLHWSIGREVPLSKSQVHTILVRVFAGEVETPLGWVPVETHTMSSEQFAELADKVEGHFSAEGVVFRDADE